MTFPVRARAASAFALFAMTLAGCSASSDAAPADDARGDGGGGGDVGVGVDAGDTGSARPDGGPDSARVTDTDAASDAPAPPPFWDDGGIPPAKNVMMFKFLNRTNGKLADREVYWSFQTGTIDELHSLAEQSTYDMPANASGRMYFFLCPAGEPSCAAGPRKSKYFDFVEHTIGKAQYNGNTTRVDAFGIKLAMKLRCADGFEQAVGEDEATFLEDRAVTFQKFVDAVPAEFKPLAEPPFAAYRIVEPGAGGFGAGGPHAHYYDAFVDALWAANGLTVAKPGPDGSGLDAYPDLSAAIFRHVGATPGTFDPAGKLLDKGLWATPAGFYAAAPADYYAAFWHARAIDGKAYGFPYDDVGGYSSYVSHGNPQTMLIAIGW